MLLNRSNSPVPSLMGEDDDDGFGSLKVIDNTTMSFSSAINEETADEFLQTLSFMSNGLRKIAIDYAGYKPRIKVLLSTPGGSVYDSLRIYDAIIASEVPVDIYATGMVASSGLFILLSGAERFSFQHTSFLYHEVSGGFAGNKSKMGDYYRHTENLVERLEELVASKTTLTPAQLKEMSLKEYWFTAQEAVDMGFVKGIVSKLS